MSYVNKVSKNNVLYDLQDSRVYTLDLGDVSSLISDNTFQKAVNADEIIALAQATEGSITFAVNGMPVICKVIAKGTYTDGGQTTTQVVASLFTQQQENSYTAYSVMGMASGNVGSVQGTMIEQSISSGGSGSGATIIEKTLSEWQSDSSGQEMAIFSIDSTDLSNAINNDNLILKLNDNEMGGNWTLQKFITQSNMVMFAQLSEQEVFMAVMMEDDGSYQGMAVKMPYEQAFGIETLKLYQHNVSMTDGTNTTIVKYVSDSDSPITDYNSFIFALNADKLHTNIVVVSNGVNLDVCALNYDSSTSDCSSLVVVSGTNLTELQASSFSTLTFTDSVYELND